jgi:hypothetical protein
LPTELTAALEPKPTQQPPKANSIAGKTSLHQRSANTTPEKLSQTTKGKNYFGKAGNNKNRIFTRLE